MGIRPALKSYSLSVVLLDHDTYNAQVPLIPSIFHRYSSFFYKNLEYSKQFLIFAEKIKTASDE